MNPLAPKYPPISLDPPTAADLALDESLRSFTREHIPVESEKELQVMKCGNLEQEMAVTNQGKRD